LESTGTIRPHPQVVDVELEGEETVLLHLDTKTYFTLNVTGARIWEAMKAGRSQVEIAELLQSEFEVDAEHATASIVSLIEELHAHGLVERED